MTVRTPRRRLRRPGLGIPVAGLLLASALGGVAAAPPAFAAGQRVLLRALVVTSGDAATVAFATELDREGIPYTTIDLGAAGRPVINDAFLEDAASGTGRFQAVFLPNQVGGSLADTELSALGAYEAAYGVRQVNGYDWPTAAMGLDAPSYSGALDGATITVTPDGLSGPFRYLTGTLSVDDVSPAVTESWAYLAQPAANLPAGQTFTPLLTAAVGQASGVVAGVYAHDGREELVLPASFNQNMQWFDEVAPGMVSWATRGIHLGIQRNYLNVQVDDVFLPDGRWSITGRCTPGDNCVDSSISTTDIRMTPAEEAALVAWQKAHGFSLDMVFNGGGAEAAKTAGGGSDPLTTAFLADQAQFRWINHTYTHQFLGCIQVAATVIGQPWHCATSPTETPRMDPEIADTLSGGIDWASQSAITQQVSDNITWATANHLTTFDPTQLVTGEHSGLVTLPQQTVDNPFLAPALSALGIQYTASDASRELDARTVSGGTTMTVPRHPMNIFYNAGTYQDEVSEYNWIYTSAANGGSDLCVANAATSTCIAPLAAGDDATAKASFDSYIKPIEVSNALRFVLTNDPRPFYAHQSNLAEDGIVYPVLEGILASYRSVFNATAPLVQTDLRGQSQALTRMSAWSAARTTVDGYVDGNGVHLPSTSVAVPVTVPAGSGGAGLEPYAGSLSGWVGGGAAITLPTASGYLVSNPATVPAAAVIGTAVAGSTTATVTWTAPGSDGGSPLTGYVVRVYPGTATTPSATTFTAGATDTSTVVTGLSNGTAYRFDVAAVNAVGTGPASARSNSVTPRAALAPVPLNVTAQPGNASATVSWTPPSNVAGVTGYRIRAYLGTSTLAARTVTVAPTLVSAPMISLTNGLGYTFTVASVYGSAAGPESARSAVVTPSLVAQTASAPSLSSVTAGPNSVTATWQPPADSTFGTPTGYRLRAYLGSGSMLVKSTTVTGTSATLSGLTNGVAYSVDVTVLYASGTGPTSARSAAVIPTATVPGAPIIGSASSGSLGGTVTATARWSAPTTTGGSAILGYRVTASRLSSTGSVLGTTTSATQPAGSRSLVMVLPVVGRYSFTVVAINAVGTSAPSAASTVVTGQ